jgi:hypothetical protein
MRVFVREMVKFRREMVLYLRGQGVIIGTDVVRNAPLIGLSARERG